MSSNFYAKANMWNIAHDGNVPFSAYAYWARNSQLRSCSEEDKMVLMPNIFQQAMRLLEAQQWKASSGKETKSLRTNNVCILVPITAIPARMKTIGSGWDYRVVANNTFKA